jgi:hypothetical protein
MADEPPAPKEEVKPPSPRKKTDLPKFTWDKKIDIKSAGKDSVRGDVNGMAIELPSGELRRSKGAWDFKVGEPDSFEDAQTLTIHLTSEPKAGAVQKKEFGPGGGYFQIISLKDKKATNSFSDTTSLNASNAFTVQFTKLPALKYDKKKGGRQEVGKAEGKIVAVYEGIESFGIKPSWVVGTFKDVPVLLEDEQTKPTPEKK